MADKFSVDDILSEYNDKKKNLTPKGEAADIKLSSQEISESDDNVGEEETEISNNSNDFKLGREGKIAINETEEKADEAAAVISSITKHKKEKIQRNSENVPPVNRASMKDIKMGLTDKIIPKTEELDRALIPDDASFEEKSQVLSQHRKKKVENFVLKTEQGEQLSATEQEKSGKNDEKSKAINGQKEFTNFEDAPQILNDILKVKSNLFLRLCILLFCGITCTLITVANDLEIPILKFLDRSISPSSYLFVITVLGLIAIAVSYNVISAGIKSIFKRRPDNDSIAAVGVLLTVASGIITLFDPESLRLGHYHIYICVGIVGLIFNTIGKYMIVQRTEKNFRYVAGEFDRYAVKNVSEEVAGNFVRSSEGDVHLASMRKTEFVEDFMKNSYSCDISDEFSKRFAPIILIAGLVVGLLSFAFEKNLTNITEKCFAALGAFSGTVSLCSSLSLGLVVNIPLNKASKKYLQYSSVMLGYSAVDEFSNTNSVLVEAQQLFPSTAVDMVNLKLLSAVNFEDCILMSASLSYQAGSILKHPFYKILKGKTEMLCPVESYIYEDGLGISGWIENKRVLLGNRKLMENHSVEGLPSVTKEADYTKGNIPVYLSISGTAAMLFIVRVSPSLSVSKWLQELESEGITTVVRTVDSFLTEKFLANIFSVEESSIKLLPFRYHKDYEKETDYVPKESSSMLCSGHFPSFAMLIVGTKRLKSVCTFGIAVELGASVLAIFIALISMVMGVFSQISASVVLLYNLVFVLVTMLTLKAKNV